MQYDEFVGQAQHRLELPTMGRTVRSIRAVLTTLGERLHPAEAEDMAGPLPMEIDRFFLEAESGQRFSLDEFVQRVSERSGVDPPDAYHQARVIVGLAAESIPGGEIRQVRDQLPDEFDALFEYVQGDAPAD